MHFRARRRALVAVPLGLLVCAMLAIAAYATLGAGSTFNAHDGNLVKDGTDVNDWGSVYNAAGDPFGFNSQTDLLQGQGDDAFGKGTSEDIPVPSIVDDSIPPNKSDLTRFYIAHETVSFLGADKTFLYLAWERISDPSGTTNMDFELNQSQAISANGETPVRTAGDVLINYDLSNGGTNPVLGYHRWLTGPPNPGDKATNVCEANSKFPCWDKVHAINDANFEGSINTVSVSDPVPPDAPRTLSPRTFGEAAINLTDTGILTGGSGGTDPCTGFAKAYLKSRSSDSFNSEIKDFVKPLDAKISLCKPAVIKLKKLDENGQPLGGATMQLFKDDGDGTLDSGDTQVGSDCTTSGTDGIGDCTFTLAALTASNGVYIGHEKTAPAGYKCCAPDVNQTVTIGQTAQTFTLEFQDQLAPGKVVVTKKDDAGNTLAGASFTLYNDKGTIGGTREDASIDTPTGITCGPTGNDGQCTLNSVPPGEYWLVETVTPTGYDTAAELHVTVNKGTASDTGDTVQVTRVDPRKHRVIVLVCHEGSDTLAPSDVTIDGVEKTSLAAGSLTAAQQKALCDTGGATFGGISGHPTKAASIAVGSDAH